MSSISIDDLKAQTIDLLKRNLGDQVHNSGASLYTGWDSLRAGNLYLMGLNPGGDPTNTGKSILQETKETKTSHNPYTDEQWQTKSRRYCAGKHPHQTSVLKLIELVSGQPDTGFFSANAVFARTVGDKQLQDPWGWWDICWPVHQFFLSIVRPKVIVCLGNGDGVSAFRFVRSKLQPASAQGYEYLNEGVAMSFRSGKWSRGVLPLSDGSTMETTILGVAHPSRYHVPAEFEAVIQSANVRQRLGLASI